jgi:hypothetical protein
MWALPEGVRCVSLGANAGESVDFGVDFDGKQVVEDIMRTLTGFNNWLYALVTRGDEGTEGGVGNLFPGW